MNLLRSQTVETLGIYFVLRLGIASILTRRDQIPHRPSRDSVTDVCLLVHTTDDPRAAAASQTN